MKREKCAGLLKEIFYQNVKDNSTISFWFGYHIGHRKRQVIYSKLTIKKTKIWKLLVWKGKLKFKILLKPWLWVMEMSQIPHNIISYTYNTEPLHNYCNCTIINSRWFISVRQWQFYWITLSIILECHTPYCFHTVI